MMGYADYRKLWKLLIDKQMKKTELVSNRQFSRIFPN